MYSTIFYEQDELLIDEGANADAVRGVRIYKKKLSALKKSVKLNIKKGDNKAAIKDLNEMENLLKRFDSEMKIVIEDQSNAEIYIGLLLYFLKSLAITFATLPLGGIPAYAVMYKDIVDLNRNVEKDIKKAGGQDKYTSTTGDMNMHIQSCRAALTKYETYIKKTKKILQSNPNKKKPFSESSLMDYDLL